MPVVQLDRGPLDGLALHYHLEGRGPAVALIHGLGGFAESWRYNTEALTHRATVLTPDLPGFGRSAKPPTRYDLTFLARALGGLLDALGIEQVSLVGHSLGGAVAVAYGLMHPDRVERIALIGALVPGVPYRLAWGARLATLPGVGEALALGRYRRLYRAALARCFHAPRAEEVAFLVDFAYEERTGWPARLAFLAALRALRDEVERRGPAYGRALAELEAPILLIHGRQDPVVPADHCAAAARTLPRAAVRWIDACGHFPQIEHARVVNDWLGEFLVGRPAPR